MSIQELCVNEMFPGESYSTDFIKIDKYKYLRLAAFSDACVYLELQFSHDFETVGITKSLYLNGKNWISESHIEPMLPYLRVKLQKADPNDTRTNLVVHVTGRLSDNLKSVSINSPAVIPKSEPSSGRRSFVFGKKKEKEPVTEKIEVTDYRLPTVLLKGSLLYVAGTNRIESIATGSPGDILMLGHDGRPFWTSH